MLRRRDPPDAHPLSAYVCTDADPGFAWCLPSVAHIAWDYRTVVRRIVRWTHNVAHGKEDRHQSFIKAEFVEGGTVAPVNNGRYGR